MRASRRRVLLGAALIAAGTVLVASPALFAAYGSWRQTDLARAAAPWHQPHVAAHSAPLRTTAQTPADPALVHQPATGQVAAFLRIPRIGVQATVLQGTSDLLLASAPGHEPMSVMPGAPGTSVIVAHNLTFFRHIDALRPGDAITVGTAEGVFTFAVQRSHVLPAGSALRNTSWPSLDLVACYPLDALYYTSQRLVVDAVLVRASRAPSPNLASLRAAPPQFLATLPKGLRSAPLWLSDTNLQVGIATFHGGPSLNLTASGASWSLTAQSIRMFSGVLRALSKNSASPLSGFGGSPRFTGLPGPGPWTVQPEAPLSVSVQLDSSGRPTEVTVEVPRARISSMGYVRTVPFSAVLAVQGDVLALSSAGTP